MTGAASGTERAGTSWQALAAGVRLLATDLDGTLLRPDGSVSATTVEVFARARAAGFPLVFVTGRPPRWLPVVAAATGHGGAAICANGGVVLDLETHEILRSHPIDPEVIDEVVRTLRAQLPGVGFAAEWVEEGSGAVARDTDFAHETAYVPRVTAAGAVVGADIRAVTAGHRVVKLLARAAGTGHDADSLLDHALEHVEHLVAVTHSNSADVLLEMSALGVDKGAALAEHAAGLGLAAADVAAAGDMPNDVPMLRWAGVGLGVAGAHPRVLEVADAVLPGPSDDGVAQFLDAVLAARG